MIFVDSNVPMYLVGTAHPNKNRTYQEILHRYASIRRLDAADEAFDVLDRDASEVLTFGMPEIRVARELVGTISGLSARDALHVAVMHQAGVERIISFDRGFDACPGIERLD